MKNNYQLWAKHYEEVLLGIYDRLSVFLSSNDSPIPTYRYFVIFVYENTERFETQLPGFLAASLDAPIR